VALTRRSLGAGLGLVAVSAAVGAGVDHVLSTVRIEKDRAALKQLADADAAREALALNRRAADAVSDKLAAITQVEAQLPSAEDPRLSVGFQRLARSRPWMAPLRAGLGYVECAIGGVTYRGAGLLLDRFGTLALCGHEFIMVPGDRAKLSVSFFPSSTPPPRLAMTMRRINAGGDLAFADLVGAPPVLAKAGLSPVPWTPAGVAQGDEVTFIGFPQGVARLHATRGVVRGPRWVETVNGDGSTALHRCKVETDGVSFSGMSGGGVFRDGAMVGLINFSSPAGARPATYFTPVGAIAAAYRALFPERASRTLTGQPSSGPVLEALSGDCAYHAGDFTKPLQP
jgi:hypothetical protein